LIGNCGIRLGKSGAPFGDLGYEISPAYWYRGYATEAARAMLDFGFEELGLHRVWAQCVPENVASRRVMEKLGMRGEGRLRQTQFYRGRWWDTLVCGVLENEWRTELGDQEWSAPNFCG
jgi:ribosomal-protein-alanine N-acetyltransferase